MLRPTGGGALPPQALNPAWPFQQPVLLQPASKKTNLKQSEGNTPSHMGPKENGLASIFHWFTLFLHADQ